MTVQTPDYDRLAEDYRRVERAIAFLEANRLRQPSLAEVASAVGLSEYHLQRTFSRWAGVSPKRFLQFLTKEHAKELLADSRDLLDVAYETGLSGPSRLHDLLVTCEAVTPGEYRQHGQGLEIAYGFHASPFGECLLAVTGRGILGLAFVEGDRRAAVLSDLLGRWAQAQVLEEPARTAPLVERIFAPSLGQGPAPLHLLVRGTNFQLKVWEALLKIPPGHVVSYQDVAAWIGLPRASRAVGRAVGQNPIAYLIPCHRVIRRVGSFGQYHWGAARKQAMLAWEAAAAHDGQTIPSFDIS